MSICRRTAAALPEQEGLARFLKSDEPMILALALLTVTQLAPESTSARLLAPEAVGSSGGPVTLKRRQHEELPGLKPAWVPMVVAGGVTLTSVGVFLIAIVAGRVGPITALAAGILGVLVLSAVHLACAIIAAVIGGANERIREEYKERQRALPAPISSAPRLQPTAVLLRF